MNSFSFGDTRSEIYSFIFKTLFIGGTIASLGLLIFAPLEIANFLLIGLILSDDQDSLSLLILAPFLLIGFVCASAITLAIMAVDCVITTTLMLASIPVIAAVNACKKIWEGLHRTCAPEPMVDNQYERSSTERLLSRSDFRPQSVNMAVDKNPVYQWHTTSENSDIFRDQQYPVAPSAPRVETDYLEIPTSQMPS